MTLMNDAGKALSKTKLDELTPMGTTNLWDGLKTGLDVLREDSVPGRTQCLMLLTDGVPNVEPPRGHIAMLRRCAACPRPNSGPLEDSSFACLVAPSVIPLLEAHHPRIFSGLDITISIP